MFFFGLVFFVPTLVQIDWPLFILIGLFKLMGDWVIIVKIKWSSVRLIDLCLDWMIFAQTDWYLFRSIDFCSDRLIGCVGGLYARQHPLHRVPLHPGMLQEAGGQVYYNCHCLLSLPQILQVSAPNTIYSYQESDKSLSDLIVCWIPIVFVKVSLECICP